MERMMDHFNGLSPAEAERLAMLAEECGEVIQIVGKILRHGYDSYHPEEPSITNRDTLGKEMRDVLAVFSVLVERDRVSEPSISDSNWAWGRKLRYAHHQEELSPKAPS